MKQWIKIVGSIVVCGALCIVIIISLNQEKEILKENNSSLQMIDANLEDKNSSQDEDKQELFYEEGTTLETRILTPEGYSRKMVEEDSFDAFLRAYPLRNHDAKVMLYNGNEKKNQNAHVAIFDMELSKRDLQQCADSIIRMYAEYFYNVGQIDKIKFQFVNGFLCEYTKWRDGYRIQVQDNHIEWVKSSEYDDSYETFEKYLDMVFAYASTLSLEEESDPIDLETLEVGDIWLRSGSPGHVVMVVDICENEEGEKAFLLAQGYMPAQQFHILKNPKSENNPWYYEEDISYPFYTPEYSFQQGQLKRLFYDLKKSG